MADFVAVIRRAVDGLANNTPEMRVRVYEKARGAVQRQLENMKPRPSDEMLRRQLEKLDAAIAAVEAEHAEALPPEPAAPVPPVPAVPVYAAPEPPAEEYAAADAQPADTDAYAEAPDAQAADSQLPEAEPLAASEPYAPVAEDVSPRDADAEDGVSATGPLDTPDTTDAVETYSAAASQPATDPFADDVHATPATSQDEDHWSTPEPASETVYQPVVEQREEPFFPSPAAAADDGWRPAEPAYAFEPNLHENREVVYDRPAYHEHVEAPAEVAAPEREDVAPTAAPASDRATDVLADFDQPRTAFSRARSEWPDAPSTVPTVASEAYDDEPVRSDAPVSAPDANDWYLPEATIETDARLADTRSTPAEPSYGTTDPAWAAPVDLGLPEAGARNQIEPDDIFRAHFDDERHATAEARMPAVADLPDLTSASRTKSADTGFDDDPLEEFLQPAAANGKTPPATGDANDPWNDLEALIGYDRNADGTGAASAATAGSRDARADSAELEALMAAPVAKSYRIKPKPKRSYAVIVLAILGLALLGGGGYAIWMNRAALTSLVGNGAGPDASGTATPAASPAAPAQTNAAAPAANTASAPAGAAPAATKEPAGPTKFTQRLLADGTEVDQGSGGPQAAASGQSVAQLNAPPAEPAAGQPANSAPAQGTPPATSAPAPAQTPAEAPALAGEKIFLYEERVGQSTPIAVEGTVSWALQNEAGENGRPEPVVQGRINIPGRGLTALVTFKRNTDASLPASHLVEFVFSLPKDFEGGAIDNVSRISMKSTEQDRGDPLIAVPAKITADFHMVALNDFPDARARNMELLRTRNWMDVPLVYNTGRRALLTMQKGPAGTKAFDDAIRGWMAMAPQQGQ